MDLIDRAHVHAALSEPARLRIVDELGASDRSVSELAALVELPGNLLAHHLDVLAGAGLVERRVSEGDRRRRYVRLVHQRLHDLAVPAREWNGSVVFVCTHNSARSQFAAALWQLRTGRPTQSAGSHPAGSVHPTALRTAADMGVDLSAARPRGYESIAGQPDLLVSVCDRARESGLPDARQSAHWSIPDPVPSGAPSAFRRAFGEIAERIERMTPTGGTR